MEESEQVCESSDTVNTVTEYNGPARMGQKEVVEVDVFLCEATVDDRLRQGLCRSCLTRNVHYLPSLPDTHQLHQLSHLRTKLMTEGN